MPTEQELAVLRRHLAKRPLACPICRSQKWSLVEVTTVKLTSAPLLSMTHMQPTILSKAEGGTVSGGVTLAGVDKALPVAILACNECQFIAHFSWVGILANQQS